MKTDELTGKYEVEENDENRLAMFRGEPSVEIEAPRKVTERRDGKLIESERAAFVKVYTTFKKELKTLDGGDLKVWLYLALSINRHTKDARPGLRKIADDLGMGVNTVRAAIERLEGKNLLDVEQEAGKGNIYHPSDYVSVTKQTVSKTDTPVSENRGTVSEVKRKTAQLEELELTRKEMPLSIENAIAIGLPVTEEMAEKASIQNNAPRQFENALGFSKPLAWWSNKQWTEFAEWVCKRYEENRLCFGEYNIWRHTQYTKGGMSNNRIRGFVNEFYDSWDMFMMSKHPKTDETRGQYRTISTLERE